MNANTLAIAHLAKGLDDLATHAMKGDVLIADRVDSLAAATDEVAQSTLAACKVLLERIEALETTVEWQRKAIRDLIESHGR